MPWIAAAVVAGGAIMNYMSNASANERAQMAQSNALQELLKAKIPDPAMQKLALQRYVSTGQLTPELQSAIKQAPSEFNKVVVDQRQKSAQNRALSELQDIGNQGGLRLQDKAALQEAELQNQVRDRGSREAILDDMNRRGQGGSGFALQAQLQGQQAAGDRAARSGLSVAAGAQDRALQALMQSGQLATQYRGQDFQEQSARAQANDAINRFNTQNLQDVSNSNVGFRNRANEMNLAQRQHLSDQNTDMANKEQQYNKELYQKQFENQMNLAGAKAGVYTQQGNLAQQQGQQQGNAWTNASTGIANAYGAQQNQDYWASENEKNRRARANQNQGSYGQGGGGGF
jgi:hypothetical protein